MKQKINMKTRNFVVWYNDQCCGVARGGIAELEDGVTLDDWLEEYGEEGDDFSYEFTTLAELKGDVDRLEKDPHWASRLRAARAIRDLAIADREVAEAIG